MIRSLRLNRETLLRLDTGHLEGVLAGAVAVPNTLTVPTIHTCKAGTCPSQTTVGGSITERSEVLVGDQRG